MEGTLRNKIDSEFHKKFPDKTITRITDYREKGIYVIAAVPNDKISERKQWLDGMYSMDMKTYKIVGGFQPLSNDPKTYFNLKPDRHIFVMK